MRLIQASGALAALLLACVPVAQAQTAGGLPDLAQIALDSTAVDGWTPDIAMRDEVWDVPLAAAAPDAPSELSWYQRRFTRDDGQEVLTTRASEARADLADAYFQQLRHNALGQTPIQLGALGSSAFGWRERDTAAAAARTASLTLELHVSGLSDADPVPDEQIASWLTQLLQAAAQVPPGPRFDWTQVLPNQERPWAFVLDAGTAGSDWSQQTGLELTTHEDGGQIESVTALREFNRTGAFRRTLNSSASVFASSDAAVRAMNAPGSEIDAPALGDATAAFRAAEGGVGHETPTVAYTVLVRRANLLMTTQESGVAWSLDSPGEAFAIANSLDIHAAQVLNQ